MSVPSLPPSLASRLVPMTPYIHRSAVISTTGREGSGKTGWALSASLIPKGKTIYVGVDRQPQGDYINGLIESRGILLPKTSFKRILAGGKIDKGQATKLWDEFTGLYTDIMKEPGIRVVILDTLAYLWALARIHAFGKLTQVMPHHYGELNSEFATLLLLAEEHGKFLIVIDPMSKEYRLGKDGKTESWTGGYKRDGFSHMEYAANIRLLHFKNEEGQFAVQVLQNKLNPGVDGRVFAGDECTFPMLAVETWGGELTDYMEI